MQINVTLNQSTHQIPVRFSQTSMVMDAGFSNMQVVDGGGVNFTTDETLSLVDGVLSVNRASSPEEDNTLPITSAAVYTTVGNINALLETI